MNDSCPGCGNELSREVVDIGIGTMRSQKAHCQFCGWDNFEEIEDILGQFDERAIRRVGMLASRTDGNQTDIKNALLAIGASVQLLHTVGKGCPDMIVGYRGINMLIEAKTKHGKLTQAQIQWHSTWRGQCIVAKTPEEVVEKVIEYVNNMYQRSE
jgi:hypothetical protein